ncbi:putative oxidoreductase CzcO [Corynebacterium urogenitale]|uniref:Putative oxidoreductase CzcO n=1 Tax=Corynebacterium urogenitale TaxID=2487892 RepID=A0A5J6Z7P3_9CORY|nr:putative oxidoreductase CzcO [Corynebacterium urogenitale]
MAGSAQGQEAFRWREVYKLIRTGVRKEKVVETDYEAIVIGGGQSGLATAFYLMRADVKTLVLDDQDQPGGAWLHTWPSLTLFSTASSSNLPGMMMPPYPGFPPASHVIDYLTAYERRYKFDVLRPVHVDDVLPIGGQSNGAADGFTVRAGERQWTARSVIGATGTWSAPFVPTYPGRFSGQQWHSSQYPGPEPFAGATVAVVGGANSGAQIAADLLPRSDVNWYTTQPPRWMPDDVDGSVLFRRSRQRLLAMQKGQTDPGPSNELGDIVMVDAVKEARDQGELVAQPMFTSLDEVDAEHLIWCTGFRPALHGLRNVVKGREARYDGVFLVGYGDWCGPGSATIAGVSPFAKATARAVAKRVDKTAR